MSIQQQIAILTNVIPQYREDMYHRLIEHYGSSLHIFCQNKIPGLNLKTVHGHFPHHLTQLKYLSLKNEKLAWQWLPCIKVLKEYDVIFVYGNIRVISNLFYSFIFRLFGKKVVIWGQYQTAGANKLLQKIRLWWWAQFNYVFLYTETEALKYKKKYPHTKLVIGMNNGLNQEEIANASKQALKKGLANWLESQGLQKKRLFLSCARLDKKNQYGLFLECLPEIINMYPDIIWCVIGKGDEETNLKKRAKELGINSNIKWVGAVYDQVKLAPWFLSSVALIHPGAIGLSLLHAMGYGLPVITHNNYNQQMPEISALKNGVNGLLFDYRKNESLIAAVQKLLEDNELRLKLSKHALQTAETRYNTKIMTNNFIQMVNCL